MANEIYLTSGDIKAVSIDSVLNELQQLSRNSTSLAQDILNICKHFEQLLNQLSVQIVASKRTGFFNLDQSAFIDANSNQYQAVLVLGAQIVFQIRTILLNEEISLLIGGTGPDGTTLLEKQVSQQNMLQKIHASLENGAIRFNMELTKLDSQSDATDSVLNQMWQSILELTDYSEINSKANPMEFGTKPSIYLDKNGNTHIRYRRYYKKTSRDTNVYASYRTKAKIKYGYYKMGNGTFSFLNTGWLYQWFRDLTLQGANQTNKLLASLNDPTNDTPLEQMIQKNDVVPGYKGGDVVANNQQYQLKFNNLKLISFTSIATVIKNLQLILTQYLAEKNNNNNQYELVNQLLNLFTDNSNMQRLNDGCDKKINELLDILHVN